MRWEVLEPVLMQIPTCGQTRIARPYDQGKLKEEDIDEVMARFEELDKDGNEQINETEVLTQENYSADIESAGFVP